VVSGTSESAGEHQRRSSPDHLIFQLDITVRSRRTIGTASSFGLILLRAPYIALRCQQRCPAGAKVAVGLSMLIESKQMELRRCTILNLRKPDPLNHGISIHSTANVNDVALRFPSFGLT
jgi:hypothetical protein